MSLLLWIAVAFFIACATLRAQDDLPKRAAGDTPNFEPKLMLDGPRASPLPGASPEDRVQQHEALLLRAQQRVADSEQLYKEGILAKVEVEARALRVIQATLELDDARLDAAAARADAVKKSFDAHNASQSDLDSANPALKAARDTAAVASRDWDKAQLAAATLDLSRKRKLYSEGVATRLEVELAEKRLALLTGTAAK